MGKYRFEDIAINCTQKRIPSEDDKENYIGLEHLESGSLYVRRWGSAVPLKGEKLIMHKGDVLLGKRNAYLRRAAICPHDGIFSAHGMVLKPRTEVIDERFFPLFIASDYFFDVAVRISVGSLSPTVNWRDLREVEFELPTLEDQRKLADVLWAINDTKESYKELIAATDELVKSQFIEIFGDPRNNAYSYKISTLKEVAQGTLSYGSTASAIQYDGRTRYVRITDIEEDGSLNNNVMSASKSDDKYLLHDGDILFARTGATVGKTCRYRESYGRAIYAGFLIRMIPDLTKVLPDYVFYFTKSDFYLDFVQQVQRIVAQPNINAQEYGDLKILVPPINRQQQFADFVQQSDKSKFELSQTLDDLNRIYKKIISDNLG